MQALLSSSMRQVHNGFPANAQLEFGYSAYGAAGVGPWEPPSR